MTSTILSTSDNWVGFDRLQYLIIFGDSFSTVGYNSKDPHPSSEHPMGVDYPGLTSCERVDERTNEITYEPNWVGHLVQTTNTQRHHDASSPPLLVYDYAVSGDTVSRMKLSQIGREFFPHLTPQPDRPAPWSSSDALFITWIGINDCTWNLRLGVSSAQATLVDFFAAQDRLYKAGARNFCFIDVPPVHLFPKGPKAPGAEGTYNAWNSLLREGAGTFASGHPDATVLAFSAWEVFLCTLAEPRSAGLEENIFDRDIDILFVDGFHPSSAMHAVISRELLHFLGSIPSSTGTTHSECSVAVAVPPI